MDFLNNDGITLAYEDTNDDLPPDSLTSEETRRAYGHALEIFLAFCEQEGSNHRRSVAVRFDRRSRFYQDCVTDGSGANREVRPVRVALVM
jgi:hypothetical protein